VIAPIGTWLAEAAFIGIETSWRSSMKSVLIAAALALAVAPIAAVPSKADSLVISSGHDHDDGVHTGVVVREHHARVVRDDDDSRCVTKTVKKVEDGKTITKTKRVCN
jgi:hypothetical protein